jgi:hypothetical protein
MDNFAKIKVPVWLIVGIVLCPLIFAWFTLKQGYSTLARGLSFTWLIFSILIVILLPDKPRPAASTAVATVEKPSEPLVASAAKPAPAGTEFTDEDLKKFREKAEKHMEELAIERSNDKPGFDWPRVDFTKPVAKVNLHDDQAIIKAVGVPVVDKEQATDPDGEPSTIYFFDESNINVLQLELSRTRIAVMWRYDSADKESSTKIFNQGQQLTRAILGGKDGAYLYEALAKGLRFDEQAFDEVVISNAKCSKLACLYEVGR